MNENNPQFDKLVSAEDFEKRRKLIEAEKQKVAAEFANAKVETGVVRSWPTEAEKQDLANKAEAAGLKPDKHVQAGVELETEIPEEHRKENLNKLLTPGQRFEKVEELRNSNTKPFQAMEDLKEIYDKHNEAA